MVYSEFELELKEKLSKIKINLNDEQIKKFYKYINLLLEWNEKINLTAITDYEEIIIKHIVDSLTINKYIKEKASVIDVGTGAGFPGMPIAIIRNDLDVSLLDSLNKRILFLEEVKKDLNLNNVKCVHSRAEEFGNDINYREKYDVATSRAVARLNVLVEYLIPFVKVGGICICMKGPNCEEEIEEAKGAIKKLGGKIEKVEKFNLNEENERTIIIIKKLEKTKKEYPRKAGIPSKKPLN